MTLGIIGRTSGQPGETIHGTYRDEAARTRRPRGERTMYATRPRTRTDAPGLAEELAAWAEALRAVHGAGSAGAALIDRATAELRQLRAEVARLRGEARGEGEGEGDFGRRAYLGWEGGAK